MGFAFTYPVVKLIAGWKIPLGAYIHYPTIRSVHADAREMNARTYID